MPIVKPLTPEQAKKSLANRLAPMADRLRQLKTNFGIRAKRVYLVWTKYQNVRGEGDEVEIKRVELLPTPKVSEVNAIAFMMSTGGVIPTGSLRLSEVSLNYTSDQLEGLYVPEKHEDEIPKNYKFYYEIVEDGRGDPMPTRQRFRLSAKPNRNETKLSWDITIERTSNDPDRYGKTFDE